MPEIAHANAAARELVAVAFFSAEHLEMEDRLRRLCDDTAVDDMRAFTMLGLAHLAAVGLRSMTKLAAERDVPHPERTMARFFAALSASDVAAIAASSTGGC